MANWLRKLSANLLPQSARLNCALAPVRAWYLNSRANSLMSDRYYRTWDLADLQQAIEFYEQAVALTPYRTVYLSNLAVGLGYRYKHNRDLADLQQTIEFYEQAVALTPEDSPVGAEYLTGVANKLYAHYKHTRDLADFQQVIEFYEQALALPPKNVPDWACYLNNLADKIYGYYNRGNGMLAGCYHTKDLADLQQVIKFYRQAVALTPEDSPDRANRLINLASGLRSRYYRSGNLADLQQAIEFCEQAVALTPEDSPDWAKYLNRLAIEQMSRHRHTWDLADLQQVIESCQQVIVLIPEDTPFWARGFSTLANELRERYARTGDLADLQQVIESSQQAFDLTPEDTPDRAGYLNNLANGLSARYRRTWDLADLQQAIKFYQQALALTPEDAPDRAMYLSNLANELSARYRRTEGLGDLQQAIKFCEQALALTPKDAPNWVSHLIILANGLSYRYKRSGDLADLQQAIEFYEQALDLTPEDAPDRTMYLSNLANGLSYRYKRSGDLADLQQAIEFYERALDLTPEDAPDRASRLSNLALGLNDRYYRSGDLADLQQAIEFYERALDLTPEDAPDRASYSTKLAIGLSDRYKRSGDLADLQQAIEFYERALDLTPEDAPSRAGRLSNLAIGLGTLYHRSGDLADLQRAIKSSQQACALTPEDALDRASYLNNLANGLISRYGRSGDLADLQQAIESSQQACALTSENAPDWASRRVNLANGLSYRYDRSGDLADLQQAIESYQQACARGLNVAAEISLLSSRSWRNWAFQRQAWEEAEQASNYARQSIKQLLKIQLVRQSQESWLREIQGLSADAAYAIARTGDLESAIVAIEEGCARLLAEALERNRSDLEQLQKRGHSDLYESYRNVTLRLNQLVQIATQHQPEGTDLWAKPSTEDIRQAKATLDRVISQIQQIPDYQDFLADPEFADIAKLVQPDTPLVYLVTTTAGSLALIVHKSVNDLESPQIKPIWLDAFTATDLRKLLGYSSELEQEGWFGSYKRYIKTRDKEDRHKWLDVLDRVTQDLWTGIMAQVVQSLQSMGVGRATLIPAGLLAFLPLHAAWTEDPNSPIGRRYALDAITFTYGPNARSLQTAYAVANQTQPISLLAVNQPRPVKASDLPSVEAEVQTAIAAFATFEELKHEQATLSNISAALKADYSVLHFACHGKVNFTEPLESGLLMANDKSLTLRELLNLRMKGVRLAVLSACETGIPGETLPDEVVSLPSGLLQSGVAGVVASLWSVADISTMMLLVRFYTFWQEENHEPAVALCQTQQWVRDTTNAQKYDYLKTHFQNLASTQQISEQEVNNLLREFMLYYIFPDGKESKSFAHPFHWAAFSYVGV